MNTKELVIPTQDGKPVMLHLHTRESESVPGRTYVALCTGDLGPLEILELEAQ